MDRLCVRGHSVTLSTRVDLQFRSKWLMWWLGPLCAHTIIARLHTTSTSSAQTLTVSDVTALTAIVHRRHLMAHYVRVLCAPCVCNLDFLHACV